MGLCIHCDHVAEDGHVECKTHHDLNIAQTRRRAKRAKTMARVRAQALAKRIADGFCRTWMCKSKATIGQLCADHADPDFRRKYGNRIMKKFLARRKEQGICAHCGWPNDRPDKRSCSDCLAHIREQQLEKVMDRRVAGKCPCGRRLRDDRFATCSLCRRRYKKYERRKLREKRALGLCAKCDQKICDGSKAFCLLHLQARRKISANWRRKQKITRGAGANGKPITTNS